MKGSIRNLIVTSVLIVTAGGLAGCATATSSIESGNDIAAAATGNPVVFGKFRLIRNGNEARIGNDLLSTTATLTLKQAGSAEEFVGAVGADGEFAWALEPGFYRVASIGFDNRGERVALEKPFATGEISAEDSKYYDFRTMPMATMLQ